MTDDQLQHHCNLATVMVGAIRSSTWPEEMRSLGLDGLQEQHTCLQILADAFVELMQRQGIKPAYRVPVRRSALKHGGGDA